MPLAVQGGDIVLHDGPVATVTLRGEHVEVVVAAVRFTVALVESILAKLLAALGTEEVFCVPRFLQRGDTFIQNRSIAVRAPWAEQIVIIGLTVRVAVALEEVPRAKLLVAVATGKVFRVPRFPEGRYHLSDDRFVAGIAAALLRCVHTLAAHVSGKIAEHRIELIGRRWQVFGGRNRRQRTLVVRGALVRLRVIRHRLVLMRGPGTDLEIRQ